MLLTNAAWVQQGSTKARRDAMDAGKAPRWSVAPGSGFETIDRVLRWTRPPSAKPAQCPTTYIGFWDTIRKLFAETLEAKAQLRRRALQLQHRRGPLPQLHEGAGVRTIEMNFLPDVKVPCETCHGALQPETLAVTWRGKSIGDVLQMEVDGRWSSSPACPSIAHPLQRCSGTWAGLPHLGQPSPRSAAAKPSASSW